MRLIDADSLLTNLDKGIQGTAREYLKYYQMAVNDEPTASDVAKVVEQLEKRRDNAVRNISLNSQSYDLAEEIEYTKKHYNSIIEMIKAVVKE